MSSHKEAPGIVNDAAADNTDVYAFVSPDKPDTVTLIANFVPLQDPAGGPNFFEFGDDVLYEIKIDNDGDAEANIVYQFRFTTEVRDESTFLYNTGPIDSLDSKNWNRRQFYDITLVTGGTSTQLASGLACPPCNIGPSSTPNYTDLATSAIHSVGNGTTVFAGQRAEGFYVDLGAIFDLGVLRPFLPEYFESMPKSGGENSTELRNIHTIALQVPKSQLLGDGADGTTPTDSNNVLGVYVSASRQTMKIFNDDGTQTNSGAFVQISRMANPLINEVIIPISKKNYWNAQDPADDKQFVGRYAHPELASLLPTLYPNTFPKLAAYKKARADIEAILLTGIPTGVVSNSFQNYTGSTQADLLRLNVAVAPTTDSPSNLGIVGGDLAGFPNGRRVFDDITSIELRALAGATIPLVDPSYKPDAAAGELTQGLTSSNTDVTAGNTVHYLDSFPYLGTPHSGYDVPENDHPAPDSKS